MYVREMTNGAKREFIKYILENEDRDFMAVAMVEMFVTGEWSTEEIEEAMFN
jgi:hypothetical protein